MSKKLYVGNLNYDAQESDLRNQFSQYGEVSSVNIIIDKFTDRSKGFGFVEMEDAASADAAISGLNGMQMMGREMKVNEAKERNPRF